jgi:hypothetical protein
VSPILPNTSAPNGRTMKPAANTSSAMMNDVVGFSPVRIGGDDRGQQPVDKIVPFEHRAQRRCRDDQLFVVCRT